MEARTIAAAAFAIVAGLASASCKQDDPYAEARQRCVDEINAYRATLDLPPYERWRDMESCADEEAKHDSEVGIYHDAFGSCGEYAQNECPGWWSVDSIIDGCLADMWAEGPGPFEDHGHFINMSSTSYTMAACGFHETGDGSIWAVQNFR